MPATRFALMILGAIAAALVTVALAVWAAPVLPFWAGPVAGVVAIAASLAVSRR